MKAAQKRCTIGNEAASKGQTIRILLLCQFQTPIRGISPYGDSLLDALQATSGIQVDPVDYISPYPAVLHPGKGPARPDSGMVHWANPRSWHRLARTEHQLIHIQHWIAPMAIYLAEIARICRQHGKSIVITVHNPSPHERSLPFMDQAEHRLFRHADAIIVHDERGAKRLEKRVEESTKSRIRVVCHGANPLDPLPTSNRITDCELIGLDPGRRYLCIFGNLRGYKGIDVLLESWQQIKDHFADTDLVIAGRLWMGTGLIGRLAAHLLGTAKTAAALTKRIDELSRDGRVKLLSGFLPDSSIDALLQVSDLAVFPYTRFDSQSGAACRAAARGCPVVVSNTGGLPDLAIDDSWIVMPNSVAELSFTLQEKLTESRLGSANRLRQIKRMRPYSWGEVARQHKEIYIASADR